ncbi:MAG TPA: ABC transporter permease [Thermoanaerobaculia bacterium]|jgi:predicted permease|nr:ABC transporter permease [Thermoanaerobaculia bacterium]
MTSLRHALRSLLKSPGFTSVAVLTLAIGIGASTSIFSIVGAVLLAPLPYPHPEQIVRVWEQAPDGHRMNIAFPNFDDFRNQNGTFATLAAYELWDVAVSGGSEPVRAQLGVVSDDFFRTFGVQPVIGRVLAPNESRERAPAIVVSYGYWKRYLGATSDLSRVRLSVAGQPYPVIGVMPADFDAPSGVSGWIARELDPETSRTAHNWRGIGRLRDGVTVAQARANLTAIAGHIKAQYGKDADLDAAEVVPLADAMVGDVRKALLTLCGAVGLLLLVGCANVAGVMLARTSARAKEFAVRIALGAGRVHVLKQFLSESLVLAAMSGIAGLLIAMWSVKLLAAIVPATLPRREGIALDTRVLLFAIGVTIAVAIALALFSSWRASTGRMQDALTAGSRSLTASRSTQRMRVVLVIGEIATTLTILVAAGLLGRSFLRLMETSPGFRAENLMTVQFSLPESPHANAQAENVQRMDRILERLRAVAGTESTGVASAMPVAHGDNLPEGSFIILRGQKPPADFKQFESMMHDPAQVGEALYCSASAGYFQTLGIPLIRGRMFSDSDTPDAPHVAVISEALARQRFGNENPIGQQLEFGNMDGNLKPLTVVGIAGDVRAAGLDRPPSPIIYTDYRQRGAGNTPVVIIRSTGAPAQVTPIIRGIFSEVAPDVPVKISTYETEIGGWLAQRRFVLLLVGLFAAVALGLAALGIYGVIAFSVARRTQEIGIRMALGARPGDVLRLVLGEAARMAAIGIAIGVAVSLSITRLMSSLLFDVRATDPWTFVSVAAVLTAVALLASYVPARRAMRVAPETALRYE